MAQKHLVLIHGFLEDASMWTDLIPRWRSQSIRIHTPELFGHGKRPDFDGMPSIQEYAVDVMGQLEINEQDHVLIIGHSMGGYVAIELAALLEVQSLGVCLFHSTSRADSEEKKTDRLRAAESANKNKELYTRTVISGLFNQENKEARRDAIEKLVAIANKMTVTGIVHAIMAMRERPDHLVEMPDRNYALFYFIGDKDPILPLDKMMTEIESLPGSVHEIAEQTGHMAYIEKPNQFAEFVQRIMRAEL